MRTKDIEHLISLIDDLINQQLNKILHHPTFQQLESSWRGLALLVDSAGNQRNVIIRVLNYSLRDLNKDLTQAVDFDQSQLFRKIYTEEFDQAGGTPYGLLIGDYYFSHKPKPPLQDSIRHLNTIAKIAACSFTPFVSGVCPSLFGLDKFSDLLPTLDLPQLFKQQEYTRWKSLRSDEDTRYIGLTLPRILMRQPYNETGIRMRQRFFKESILSEDDYLWGNAAYAYGCVVIRCFQESGWFADIRGINPQTQSGGTLDLERSYHATDAPGLAAKPTTELLVTDEQEKTFSEIGFLALCDDPYSEISTFHSSQSIQISKRYSTQAGSVNANISSMLHYILCSSRFAHYVKIIMRDKVGSFLNASDCERYMRHWINNYCADNSKMAEESKHKYPLNEARISITENSSNPGHYQCVMHLKPHYQLDSIQSHLKLTTNVKLK